MFKYSLILFINFFLIYSFSQNNVNDLTDPNKLELVFFEDFNTFPNDKWDLKYKYGATKPLIGTPEFLAQENTNNLFVGESLVGHSVLNYQIKREDNFAWDVNTNSFNIEAPEWLFWPCNVKAGDTKCTVGLFKEKIRDRISGSKKWYGLSQSFGSNLESYLMNIDSKDDDISIDALYWYLSSELDKDKKNIHWKYSLPKGFFSKEQFHYGYFEMRVKLPKIPIDKNLNGTGFAFWLIHNDDCGGDKDCYSEFDVFELRDNWTGSALFYGDCNDGNMASTDHISYGHTVGEYEFNDSMWHTFGVNWTEQSLTVYFDNEIKYIENGRYAKDFTAMNIASRDGNWILVCLRTT